MSKRLYVGNISFKATEDDVRDLFSQAGEVVSVKLIQDAATGS
jgi:RNA recognition motif-containing protein